MYEGKRVTALIMAAGSGTRLGGPLPKQFLKIGGRTILERSLLPFEKNEYVDDVLVACGRDFIELCSRICAGFAKNRAVVEGGATRQESVRNALAQAADGYILIHDGARPFVSEEIIDRVLAAAAENGAAVCAVPVKDTIRRLDPDGGSRTLDRDELRAVQTPQGFDSGLLREAFRRAEEEGFLATDDAGLVERLGRPVAIVDGSYGNIKITTKEDLPMDVRTGSGYDVHRFAEGRKLILCGVEIPFEKGLLGHSDADVALHALMDAILGAAALGDIGRHFPDGDERYRGISSMELLRQVDALVRAKGYCVSNADVTIIAQRPKMLPYIEQMRANIASVLGVDIERVNVKATTTEKLGFAGREEGVAAQAACLISGGRRAANTI